MAVEVPRKYVLGDFELEPEKYSLKHDGESVHLPELPFQVLLYLVENRARYVSRQELLERFWSGSQGYEETLTKCISTIRTQLNDPPNSPRFIETRKKVGYRYIGPLAEEPSALTPSVFTIERMRGVRMVAEEEGASGEEIARSFAIGGSVANDVLPVRQAEVRIVAHAPSPVRLTSVRTKKLLIVATCLALFACVLIGGYFRFFTHRTALTEKDTVLVADFVNTTGDSVFDGTLKQALTVQLQQTPFLSILPEESVGETLRMMEHPPSERVTRENGIEICQRRGIKVLVTGSVASLGNKYVLTLDAIKSQSGETITSQQVQAEGKEQVLSAVGNAALNLRKQLGESLSTIQKYNAPIEQATTSSLEALKAYSQGVEQFYLGHHRDSVAWFSRAIELDPNFADAYAYLAWDYNAFDDPVKTVDFAQKAFALRDQVSEVEQFNIDDTYYALVTGEMDKDNQLHELWERLYPNDYRPHTMLAINFSKTGEFEQAVTEAREVMRLNPPSFRGDRLLSIALIRLNRFDEARDVLSKALANKPHGIPVRLAMYQVAFVQGDAQMMREQIDSLIRENGEQAVALYVQAGAASCTGRLREAGADYRRAAELEPNNYNRVLTSLPSIEATRWETLFGFCKPGGKTVAQSFAPSRIALPTEVLNVPFLADGSLCGDPKTAEAFAEELVNRYPKATLVNGISLPTIRAAIALRRNRPDQALEFLKPALPYEGGAGFVSNYLRGEAYLRLKRSAEAEEEFHKILEHRGWAPLSPLYPLADLGLARAAAMAGDHDKSRKAYEDFFALWKDADQDLPILIKARREYGTLK